MVSVSSSRWVVCISIYQPWSVESETVSCHLPFRLSSVHLDFAISTRFQLVPWGPHIVTGTAAAVKSLMKAPTVAHFCEGKTNTEPSPAPNKYHKYTNAKDLLKYPRVWCGKNQRKKREGRV